MANTTYTTPGLAQSSSGINVLSSADATTTIFARTSGNDTTGDGSSGNPYRTFQRCVLDIPQNIFRHLYTIDITGIGTETLPSGYRLPAYNTQTRSLSAVSPQSLLYSFSSTINIFADTTVDYTFVTPAWSSDGNTGLTTLTENGPNPNWTTNQWKGFVLRGTGSVTQHCIIASNTANTLELCTIAASFTGTITINHQSARLDNFDVRFGTYALEIAGIEFGTAPNFGRGDIFLQLDACKLDAGGTFTCNTQTTATAVYAVGSMGFENGIHAWSNSLFSSGNFGSTAFYSSNVGYEFNACIFDTCAPVGHPIATGRNTTAPGLYPQFVLKNCYVRNGTSHGVQFLGGCRSMVYKTAFSNNTGSGIYAEGPGQLLCDNAFSGTTNNTRYGVEVVDGAHVRVESDLPCTVTGTLGDVKVGNNATRTWANITNTAPIGLEVDYQNSMSCLTLNNTTATTNITTGSGTSNTIAKYTGSLTVGNSSITDDGSTVTITLSSQQCLAVDGYGGSDGYSGVLITWDNAGTPTVERIKVGGPNTGPGGAGRALYIDN